MINGRVKKIARAKMVWATLALVIAGSAHAAATLIGGGSTLTSVAFVGSNAASTTNTQFFGSGVGNGIAPGSLFGVYAAQTGNPGVSYCLAGDAAGKNVLAGGTIGGNTFGGGNTYSVQNACAHNNSGVFTGFGADSAGLVALGLARPDLTQPNFVASDSPLTDSDLRNYQDSHGSTAWPTQFPAIASSIAIAFNLKDNTGAQVTSSEVNFTDAQICEIFSGSVYLWNDPSLASAFLGLPAGHSIPANPINVEYRSDGSGTSFSFSNHLATVCTALAHDFETSQNFVGPSPAVTSNFFTTAPANWTGASGDDGVARAVANTAYSIGYVATANVLNSGLSLQFADVNSTSPVTNFGTPFVAVPADYVYNNVINSTNASNGWAQLTPISNPPRTSCIVLVKPSTYAIATRGGLVPLGSYPIVAFSYFLGNAQGNESTDLAATRNLVNAPYNLSIVSAVTTIGPGTGLAFVNPRGGFGNSTAAGNCLH